jgi:hypothetical protein
MDFAEKVIFALLLTFSVSLWDTPEMDLFHCEIQRNRICSHLGYNRSDSDPLWDTAGQIDTKEDIFKL